jgi:D-alanine-D-alanine ligase
MRKLRILALMHQELVPPADTTGYDVAEVDWKTEFDVVSTLEELGHEVHSLGVGSDLGVIRDAIEERKPHVTFNLLEDFHDVPIFDQNVVSYLELLRMAYTGCNPRGLMLARDKALSKKVLIYHRIPVPDFAVIRRGRAAVRPKRLTFPLIVKSLVYEGSLGISQASVVEDDQKLEQRVRFVHDNLESDALVERYIEGRELYVGILGNERLQVFPVWELRFTKMPEEAWRIATGSVKWSRAYQERHGIETDEASTLSDATRERIQHVCKRVYRILGMSGYARMDVRMEPNGKLYVLEANPNPHLGYGEDFAESAERAGVSYEELMQRILNLGLRWRSAKTV